MSAPFEIVELSPESFPPLLQEIPDAPNRLYLRGSLPEPEQKLLAVVGSRRMTRYGKDACDLTSYPERRTLNTMKLFSGEHRPRCPACFGNTEKGCNNCGGRGYKKQGNTKVDCLNCFGSGKVPINCDYCNGTGLWPR